MKSNGLWFKTKMQLRYALIIAKKDARIYYLKAPVLIFGLLFPLALFLAFTIGRKIPVDVLLPGLVGITLFFTASSANPLIAPWETRMRTLERLISTPASIASIILGDILSGFLFGAFISIVPLSICIFAFGAKIANPLILVIDITLGAFCFSALGSLLSTPPTDNPSNIMMLSNLVRLPLIFISGVFIPIDRMPAWGRIIAPISPLTYTCDLARYALGGRGYYPILLDLIMILIFATGFTIIGIEIHKRSMPKRLVCG